MKQVLEKLAVLERQGFTLLKAVVPAEQIEQLIAVVEELRAERSVPGLRNLLCNSPKLKT